MNGSEPMTGSIIRRDGELFAHDPALRGYHAVYRPGEANRCPGCGRTHWIIGRLSAECAFCATALPLAETGMTGAGTFLRGRPVEWALPDAA